MQGLINEGRLQKVAASRTHADRLTQQAKRHLASASTIANSDPEGAYALLYTASRKALTAVLEVQGLRPTVSGGHVVVYLALRAQLDPPMGKIILSFNRMRRSRHDNEYPPVSEPELSLNDVLEDLDKSADIVGRAEKLLDEFPIF